MHNRLWIANLAKNDYQRSIDLDPYKVDFFFEKGTHNPSTFEDLGKKSIFFCAKNGERRNILCYTKSAWKEQPGYIQVV